MKVLVAVCLWVSCGALGAASQIGYLNTVEPYDAVCRHPENAWACDELLWQDEALRWFMVFGGPVYLVPSAIITGFFSGGFALTRTYKTKDVTA